MRIAVKIFQWSALCWLAAAMPLQAQEAGSIVKQGRYWVSTQEGSLPAGGRLRVSTTGAVKVVGRPSREFRYKVVKKLRAANVQEARRLFERARLSAARQGTTAVISLVDPRCGRCGFSAETEILAPETTQVTILSTDGGSVSVENLQGRVNAETAGGAIRMNAIGGAVRAVTAGGAIELGSIGGEVRCETSGGSIKLGSGGGNAVLVTSGGNIEAGEVAGDLRAETAGGSISADKVGRSVTAGTAGGSIRLGDVGGLVRAETAGGSIFVRSAPAGVRAETSGGNIELENVAGAVQAANAAGSIRAYFIKGRPVSDSFLETNAGTIVVWLPETLAVTIEATVDLARRLNRIQSEFSVIKVHREDQGFGAGTVIAEGELNGGGPVIRIRNTSGTIQIRKRVE